MGRQNVTVVIGALLLSSAVQAQEYRLPATGKTSVDNYVQSLFFLTQSSGSLTLRGTCRDTQQGRVVVSDLLANPPQGPFKNLAEAMTALSKVAPHLSWTRNGEGLMRVSDDRVIGDVLQVRVKRVRFRGAVDPTTAIEEVMSAPEVRKYLDQGHIEGVTLRTTFVTPSKDLPKLSGDLRDVTVAQALDRIVRFFPGLWVYGECSCDSFRRVTVRAAQVAWPPGSDLQGRQGPER